MSKSLSNLCWLQTLTTCQKLVLIDSSHLCLPSLVSVQDHFVYMPVFMAATTTDSSFSESFWVSLYAEMPMGALNGQPSTWIHSTRKGISMRLRHQSYFLSLPFPITTSLKSSRLGAYHRQRLAHMPHLLFAFSPSLWESEVGVGTDKREHFAIKRI